MLRIELQQEDAENTLLTYISKKYFLQLDTFANSIPTNSIIDIFDIILCIYVHFQQCFQHLSKT